MPRISRKTFLQLGALAGTATILGPLPELDQLSGRGDLAAAPPVDITSIQGGDYYENTRKAVEHLGGIGRFVRPGTKVGLLINSSFRNPGSFTHPDIALAIVRLCREAGAASVRCLKGEGDGYWRRSKIHRQHRKDIAALRPAAGEHVTVRIAGKKLKQAEVLRDLLECDVLINLPIMKDHSGTGYTGCLKNMMGSTTHSTNRYFHFGDSMLSNIIRGGWYNDIDHLSQCIADLNLVRKSDLCVVDGTRFVTTNGPYGPGRLKTLNRVIAGTDRVALDAYCSGLLGRRPEKIAMIRFAARHGLGSQNLSSLKIFAN